MRKGNGPDPYLWLMDPNTDPIGQKTSGSGSPTLVINLYKIQNRWIPVFISIHFGRGENGKNGGSAPAAVNGSDHEEEEDDRWDQNIYIYK